MKICPKCKKEHQNNGVFCCRSCANSRDMSSRIGTKSPKEWNEKNKKALKEYWSNEENRKKQSEIMKNVVLKNPDSYSKNNVSGRVKMYEIDSPFGPTKVKGKWELKVASFLNDNSILWTNDIKPFSYQWKGKWHLYFPDFYLPEYKRYIEVKGYKTERDDAKWAVVDNILIIEKNELDNLFDVNF